MKSWWEQEQAPREFDASGVFETCRVRRGEVLCLNEHLARLRASLRTVGIGPWDEGEARRQLIRAACGIRDGYVRVAVRRWGDPRLVVHRCRRAPYSRWKMMKGISIRTVAARWPTGEASFAQAKLSERLAGVLAKVESPAAGEVLRLGPHGYVTEGTVSNLFFFSEGRLTTAPRWLGVLEGVTRSRVIQAAGRLKIPVREAPFTRHELFNAEEAFLTNVLIGMAPVREVDGRRIGRRVPGPVTLRLRQKGSGRPGTFP